MPRVILLAAVFLQLTYFVQSQPLIASKNTMQFSAIKGTASKTVSLQLPAAAKVVLFKNGDTSKFRILSFDKSKLQVLFQPDTNFTGIARAALQVKNAAGKIIWFISLSGLSTNGLEGRNEAPLSQVITALGFKINAGWATLDNNSLPALQGDEIPFAVFKKSSTAKVELIPVARYSPDFELPFGYYTIEGSMANKKQVGVLAKAGNYPEHQCLFPALASGSTSFDPGNNSFGFFTTGPTHSAYSEDVWNMLLHPGNAVHAARIYPLKDLTGKSVPNSYLLCFEEAKNGDYNDYVFIVKNIAPVTQDPFIRLFNGSNLQGWRTYLKDYGINKDPDNNFIIRDSAVHVKGKDLGYMITENSYANYHFKVDFKWGKQKWASRVNLVRDAGVCYNIPVNEPDSIWPQSIECQVQEGDVGDFWLLGFSTIKVNGVQNKPANHTRMIKQKDAERPSGEWNTLEIISYNGNCIHIVNAVVVNVGTDASITSGRILLQSEYAEVYYKNVLLRKL